jgi:hypothetical protein
MGQTAGDCKVVVRDQNQTPIEQPQPTGFHLQLNTPDQSPLVSLANTKQVDCPYLPALTINDQESNANALRPTDGAVPPAGNSVQSTYEALDRQAGSGTKPLFSNDVASIVSGPSLSDEPNLNENALRPGDGTVRPSGNEIPSTYGGLDLNLPVPNGTSLQTNAEAIRWYSTPPNNAIQSTYEALDVNQTVTNAINPRWNPNAGCPVNPEQPNTNAIMPDEAQDQSQILKRLNLNSLPVGSQTQPQ